METTFSRIRFDNGEELIVRENLKKEIRFSMKIHQVFNQQAVDAGTEASFSSFEVIVARDYDELLAKITSQTRFASSKVIKTDDLELYEVFDELSKQEQRQLMIDMGDGAGLC